MRYLWSGGALIIGLIIVVWLVSSIRITPPPRDTPTPAMEICHEPTGFGPQDAPGN